MSEIIDHKTIRLPHNYVLVKPNNDLKKYHLDGKETSIFVGVSAMVDNDPEDSLDFSQKETMVTHADHWSITGEVIQVPEKLVFYGDEIKRVSSRSQLYDSDVLQIQKLASSSLQYESPMELEIGNTVVFDAAVHVDCNEMGKVIETDIGDLYLIRYDRLIGVVMSDDYVYPLNGLVFFKWNKKTLKQKGELLYHELEKDIWDADPKELHEGQVLEIGRFIKRSLKGGVLNDIPFFDMKKGDEFLFRQLHAYNVENQGHHYLWKGEIVYAIHSQDIIAKK